MTAEQLINTISVNRNLYVYCISNITLHFYSLLLYEQVKPRKQKNRKKIKYTIDKREKM